MEHVHEGHKIFGFALTLVCFSRHIVLNRLAVQEACEKRLAQHVNGEWLLVGAPIGRRYPPAEFIVGMLNYGVIQEGSELLGAITLLDSAGVAPLEPLEECGFALCRLVLRFLVFFKIRAKKGTEFHHHYGREETQLGKSVMGRNISLIEQPNVVLCVDFALKLAAAGPKETRYLVL